MSGAGLEAGGSRTGHSQLWLEGRGLWEGQPGLGAMAAPVGRVPGGGRGHREGRQLPVRIVLGAFVVRRAPCGGRSLESGGDVLTSSPAGCRPRPTPRAHSFLPLFPRPCSDLHVLICVALGPPAPRKLMTMRAPSPAGTLRPGQPCRPRSHWKEPSRYPLPVARRGWVGVTESRTVLALPGPFRRLPPAA